MPLNAIAYLSKKRRIANHHFDVCFLLFFNNQTLLCDFFFLSTIHYFWVSTGLQPATHTHIRLLLKIAHSGFLAETNPPARTRINKVL